MNSANQPITKCCTKCKKIKQLRLFGKSKREKSGIKSWCKDCLNNLAKELGKTPVGLATKIYAHQKRSARSRNHDLPNYSNKEFLRWMITRENFNELFDNWKKSGNNKNLTPSADRIDDYKSYTLDNIKMVTWEENNKRSHRDLYNGINRKTSKPVIKSDLNGAKVDEYYSVSQAARENNVTQQRISACCCGKQKTSAGYLWEFA